MPDFKSSSESFVEGIGNDVVYATLILLLLIGLVFSFFFCVYHRVAEPAIHAASSQRVAEVREIRNRLQHGNGETEFRRERRANYSFCPVCLGNAQYPVETNCGHVFCGQCIITYWETAQDRMETVRCPTCRQQVRFRQTSQLNVRERANGL